MTLARIDGLRTGGPLFRVDQNYPNPLNPATVIGYDLPQPAFVRLRVFDALGRLVSVLEEGAVPAGEHEIRFHAGNLSSGVYFYGLEAGTFVQTKTMIVAR